MSEKMVSHVYIILNIESILNERSFSLGILTLLTNFKKLF